MTPREIRLAFSAVLAALMLAGLDGTAVAPALPRIVGDLHGFDRISWVVTAYLLASTVTIPLYGKLSDLFGRRALFTVAISVFLVGSVLCAASQTMVELVVARGVQGIGAGGLVPLAVTTIGDLYSPRERGRIQSYTAAIFSVTSVGGPLLGGLLTDHASWRWIFLINLPVGGAALAIVLLFMRIPRRERETSIDVLGSVTMIAGSSLVLLGLVWGGNQHPWGSPQVIGALAAGAALTVAFVAAERRAREPILAPSLFRNRTFAVSVAFTPFFGAAMVIVTLYIPIYVQQVVHTSATGSGVVLIPFMLSWVLSAMVIGRLVSRTGRYKVFPVAGSLLMVVGFVLLSQLGVEASQLQVVGVMAVLGVGMGPLFGTITVALQNSVASSEIGASTAGLQFIRSLGGVVGLAGFAAVLTARLSGELERRLPPGTVAAKRLLEPRATGLAPDAAAAARAALAAALDHTYLLCIPALVVAACIIWLLPELPLRTVAPHEEVRSDA